MLGKVSFYNCETDKYFSRYVTEFESVSSFHILKFSLHNLNKFVHVFTYLETLQQKIWKITRGF